MASSHDARSRKINILLWIDSAFFLLELVSGVMTGSLALISDSFHMLNDIFSLVVALQALKLAEGNSASSKYSYGWQRAEVLGALINGVFLLALCLSIGLEAFTRFFQSVEVTNPKLIVIVGSAGLCSNILGLLLFHDHGHSHGGHSHSHAGHSHGAGDIEAAKPKSHSHSSRSHSHSHSHSHSDSPTDRTPLLQSAPATTSPSPLASSATSDTTRVRANSDSSSDDDSSEDLENVVESIEEELFVHPGEFRGNIVRQAQDAGYGAVASGSATKKGHSHDHSAHSHDHDHGHDAHEHARGEEDHAEASGGGHDGAMNMRGVFLHVLGDALGNVGVIGAGLFIWLTDYSWRSYVDPIVSLFITCIIFSSALPLVKSASFILLQGVPSSVPLDEVRNAIAAVTGVLNVHELHIWSLSESKTVCSVHVMTNSEDFVPASKAIRKVLHRFGVHSSTIQPEIVGAKASQALVPAPDPEQDGCAVLCVDDSCRESSCCPPETSAILPPPAA